MNALNEAKLAIIEQINNAIVATNDAAERTALVGLLLNPELDLEPEIAQPKFINYGNIGHRYDTEERLLIRAEKLEAQLLGL